MTPTQHNLDAILVGTGEFRFCQGATSAADAKLKGYRDFDNITAFTPETQNEFTEHEGSYRGVKVVDKKYSTKIALEYVLTQDAWTRGNLKLLFMANDKTGHTQSVQNAAAGDYMAFTAPAPAVKGRWYDIYVGGARIRSMTSLVLYTESASVSVVADDSTDKITETDHGREDGDPIIFGGTAAPGGLTLGTVYYVKSKTTSTYEVSLTSGGATINLTSAGTSVTARGCLVKDVDYTEDLTLGAIRMVTAYAATIYPVVTAPAITSSDTGYFYGLDPLANPTIEGYGRLTIFDGNDVNAVVVDHVDFACTIAAEKGASVDGKKPSEFSVRVTVGDDVGTIFVRQANEDE